MGRGCVYSGMHVSVGVSWCFIHRLFLQMECTYQEEESDEISMALSSDAEAKVTLIDCMYIYIYTYLSIYLFPISIVSQVAQLQTAVVNGTYYTPHYLLFIPYLPIPLCLDFRPLNIVLLLTDSHDEQVVLTDSQVLLTDSNEKQISG